MMINKNHFEKYKKNVNVSTLIFRLLLGCFSQDEPHLTDLFRSRTGSFRLTENHCKNCLKAYARRPLSSSAHLH